MKEESLLRAATTIKQVLLFGGFVLGIYVLKAMQDMFVPVVFAALLTIVIAPFQERLDTALKQKYRAVSLLISMLLVLLILGFFAGAVLFSLGSIADSFPSYSAKFGEYWNRLNDWIAGQPLLAPRLKDDAQIQGLGDKAFSAITGFLSSAGSFISAVVLVFFLVLFFLIELSRLKRKIASVFSAPGRKYIVTAISGVAVKIRQFLVVKSGISLLDGIGVGVWLAVFGVDSAVALGVLTFLTDYIPYIGSVIAVVLPTIVAFLQFGAKKALIVFIGLLLINQAVSYFIEPRVESKLFTISPITLLLSLVFWSWVWGVAGTLLSVPLTIACISVCENIPSLKALSELLKA